MFRILMLVLGIALATAASARDIASMNITPERAFSAEHARAENVMRAS
ncbi:MAG TPA: hypothetical protein VI565_01900 [Burkholderiales bacterium]|nr:hypothetical protein [Burkholderiales bacterium]